MTEHTDLAWMAGLFEGEGWVHITCKTAGDRPSGLRYSLIAGVTNSDKSLLEPFLVWGGRVRRRRGTALSKRIIYEWRLEAVKASRFLEAIKPYLRGNKSRKADIGIAFQARIHSKLGPKLTEGEIQWRNRQKELLSQYGRE